MDNLELVRALDRELSHDRNRLRRYDAYYEGQQPLRYMAPALEAEIGDRITQLIINWPRMVVDAYEHRLDVEGFRYVGKDSGDDELWDMWQANDGDEQSQQGHQESLINGSSYVIVGSPDSDDDAPVMTVEHPLQVRVRRNPKNRTVTAALKRWQDDTNAQRAHLYLPDATVGYVRRRNGWEQDEVDEHQLGVVPVVQLPNRARMLRPLGISEFTDVVPIADAANTMATNMMVSGEFHSMPRRWVVGMAEDDFLDDNGQPLSAWSAIAGRLWMTENKDAKLGQFQESDLAVFHNTIKLLAQACAQLMFLPQDYMSFTSDNPTSADAMRASEARFIKGCERKHTPLGGGWETVNRIMLRIKHGTWDPAARRLETLWRDPATPTFAQKADAVVKLVQAGVIPAEQGREDLGYSDEQRRRMREMDAAAVDRNLLGSLADAFRQPTPTPDPAGAGAA